MKFRFKFFTFLFSLTCLIFIFSFAAKKSNQNKTVQKDSFADLYSDFYVQVNQNSLKYIEDKNYSLAINEFKRNIEDNLNALNYNRDKFNESQAKTSLNEIDKQIKIINSNIEKYIGLQTDIADLKVSPMMASSSKFYEDIFDSLGDIRTNFYQVAQFLKKSPSDEYCRSLYNFVNGVNEKEFTGILGVIDAQWNNLYKSIENILDKNIEEQIKIITNYFDNPNNLEEKKSVLPIIEALKKIDSNLISLDELYAINFKLPLEDDKNKIKSINNKIDSAKTFQALSKEILELVENINSINEIENTLSDKPDNYIETLRNNNDEYSSKLVNAASKISQVGRLATKQKKSDTLYNFMDFTNISSSWSKLINSYRMFCTKIEGYSTNKSINLWIQAASFFAESSQDFFNLNTKKLNELKLLISDQNEKKYPGKCLNEIDILIPIIENDINVLLSCKEKLNDGYLYRSNFINEQQILNKQIDSLKNIIADCNLLINEARKKLLIAQTAKNEINLFYNISLQNYKDNNFNSSYDNLIKAQNIYIQKIEELKNDGDIQETTFQELAKLRQNIIEKEKPKFQEEIRKCKNESRIAYYAGDFNLANSILIQIDEKREIWAKLMDIELEKDSELERLKDYVNTALAIKEGREISPYDSKAPEMKQILSLAHKYYNQANIYLSQGKESEARDLLNNSKTKLNQIKVYYPRNKDASLLNLRIDKILYKDTFNQTFEAKVEALKETRFEEKNAMAQQAYSDLLDLYELEPNYPNLKNIIYTAEVKLGLRQEKLSEKSIEKSKSLTQEAQRIFNSAGRDEVLLQQAKQLAEQAVSINPQNSSAILLLDEISLRTGSQAAVILNTEDEEIYQKALIDLQNNRIIEASIKLEKLLSNKKNSNSAKILKLKKRIEAQL